MESVLNLLQNMASYVALPSMLHIGGMFALSLTFIKEKQLAQISALLQQALEIAHAAPLPTIAIIHSE